MPPAGYVCFLRDVSYGNRYQIRVVGAPAELSRHLAQAFEVEVALVLQADDAERIGRELLEFAGGASAGEWFDLADDQFQHLRELGLAGQRGQQQRRRTQTFSSLLEESGPRSSRPRSTSHRHVNRAAAIPSQRQERPARQRSTAHRTTNRATTPRSPETSARAAQPRRRNRNSRLFFIIVFLIIFGGLYGAITERDPVADLLHLAGTVRAFTVNTQATETATAIPTKPPPTATLTATYTSTATSSPEPSATSTWTPVPSATISLRMVVETRNGLGANVRACPWTSCEIIDTLRPGHEIFGLGRVEGEEVYGSTDWVQFEIDGVAAYIHSELIEAER